MSYQESMDAGRALRDARGWAGVSQRGLSARTGVAQPTIARIESGREDPRVATLARLLDACGLELQAAPARALPRGAGVDRSLIRAMLALAPAERLRALVDEAKVLSRLEGARQVG